MSNRASSASIANIKAALRKSDSCQSGTVDLLRELLQLQLDDVIIGNQRSTTIAGGPVDLGKPTKSTSVQSGPKCRASRTGKALEPEDRARLAVDVANIALKTLTEAVRNEYALVVSYEKLTAANENQSQPHDITDRQIAGRRNLSLCASLAFLAISNAKLPAMAGGYQAESGMSSLIGKMIALSQHDLASRQINILLNLLLSGHESEALQMKARFLHESLLDHLRKDQLPPTSKGVMLLISTHVHILKLLAASGYATHSDILKAIGIKETCGTATMIFEAHNRNLVTTEGATKQLESLSRALYDLSVGYGKTLTSQNQRKSRPSAFQTLDYRLLAHKAHLDACNILGSPATTFTEDLTKSLYKSLKYLTRSSEIIPKEHCPGVISRLREQMILQSSSQKQLEPMALEHIRGSNDKDIEVMLRQIAERAGSDQTSHVDSTRASPLSTDTDSSSSIGRIRELCEQVAASMRSESNLNQQTSAKLSKLSSFLRDLDAVETSEAEEIFISLSTIRRLSHKLLRQHGSLSSSTFIGIAQLKLIGYVDIIFSIPQYLLLYVSSLKTTDDKSEDNLLDHRITMISRVALQSFDAVFQALKLIATDEEALLENCFTAANSFLQLIQFFDAKQSDHRSDAIKQVIPAIAPHISDVFLSVFLYLNGKNVTFFDTLAVLGSSVDVLRPLTIEDRTKAKFSNKLERLSRELSKRSLHNEALARFEEALTSHMHDHTTRRIQASDRSPSCSGELYQCDSLLAKMLTRHLRTAIHADARPFFWITRCSNLSDQMNLVDSMQETQMLEMLSLAQRKDMCSLALLKACSQLFETELCKSRPPETRMRWLGILLHASVLREIDDAPELRIRLKVIFSQTLAELEDNDGDVGYRVASCQIGLILISDDIQPASVLAALERWRRAVQKTTSTAQSLKFYPSSDQLELLDTLADYLEHHKFNDLYRYCLELAADSHLKLDSTEPQKVTAIRYRLAKVYLDSGLVDQAYAMIVALSARQHESVGDSLFDMKVSALKLICMTKMGLRDEAMTHLQQWLSVIRDFAASDYRRPESLMAFADLIQAVSILKEACMEGDEALYYAKFYAKLSLMILPQRKAARMKSDNEENHQNIQNYTSSHCAPSTEDATLSYKPLALWQSASMLKAADRAFTALLRLTFSLASAGQLQEALQLLSQATSLAARAELLESSQRAKILQIYLQTLQYEAYKAESEDGSSLLDIHTDASRLEMMFVLCSSQIEVGNYQYAQNLIRHIAATLRNLEETKAISGDATVDTLQDGLKSLSFEHRAPSRLKNKRSNIIKKDEPVVPMKTPTIASTQDGSRACSEFYNQLVIQQAAIKCIVGKFEPCFDLLSGLDKQVLSHYDAAQANLIKARAAYQLAIDTQVLSPIFGGLTDLPLAVPGPKSKSHQIPQMRVSRKRQAAHSGPVSSTATRVNESPENVTKANISNLLQRGQSALREALSHCHDGSPTYRTHKISDALCQIEFLLCAIEKNHRSQINLYEMVNWFELGRNLAWQRLSNNMAIERRLQDITQSDILGMQFSNAQTSVDKMTAEAFSQRYIEVIPKSWIVISLSVSEDRCSLRLSRLRRDAEPLLVSLPLNRQVEEEMIGGFGFSDCTKELFDIVTAANTSTNNPNTQIGRGAKREWWQKRAQLDQRMKELLVSIEELWLGGFRGIFHQHKISESAFDTLSKKLEVILDSYLPSRISRAKNTADSYLVLSQSILEIFVGLGPPDDDGSLDDSLLDLLTFIVDTFQLQGERNAHDEIDFDSIILDVTSALRQYHISSSKQSDLDWNPHTVLILDKHLHGIPWESLPCSQGSSISRLPSLEAMRNILLNKGSEGGISAGTSELKVRSSNGAYVLNPASDLSHTENVFTPLLSQLPISWQGLTRVVPEESQLEEMLRSRDIFLYFGHGSGAQYIRGKTIRKLPKCAVSLLMGCSSVTVSEAGRFESSGVPLNYLLAGAPAVVGTLWDVTDKDIDRFSVEVLKSWGLLRPEKGRLNAHRASSKQAGSTTRKGGSDPKKQERLDQTDDLISLDKAVALARSACIMRYLNGAAPVMYGLPVVLDK